MRIISILCAAFILKFSSCSGFLELRLLDTTGDALDISNPNHDIIHYCVKSFGSMTFRRYRPKEGISIVSVVDSDFSIWDAGPGVKFRFAKSYTTKSGSLLTLCTTYNGSFDFHYFVKTGINWEIVARSRFADVLENMFQ